MKPNIHTEIHSVLWDCMDWIDLVQDRGQRRALVNAVMNLQDPSYLSKTHFNIVYPPTTPTGVPSGLFPSGFPTNILYAFLFSPIVLHALPISSSLT
jgi:hypothetical protein